MRNGTFGPISSDAAHLANAEDALANADSVSGCILMEEQCEGVAAVLTMWYNLADEDEASSQTPWQVQPGGDRAMSDDSSDNEMITVRCSEQA